MTHKMKPNLAAIKARLDEPVTPLFYYSSSTGDYVPEESVGTYHKDASDLLTLLEECEAKLLKAEQGRDALKNILTDGAPITAPLQRNPNLRVWQQVVSLFSNNGILFPTTRFRDEISTMFQWAWFGHVITSKAQFLDDGAPEQVDTNSTKPEEVHRAADALLSTLWQLVWTGTRSFDENWNEMDRRYPQARWLHNALKGLPHNAPIISQEDKAKYTASESEPGEHQEVLDAIESCNTGEDQ